MSGDDGEWTNGQVAQRRFWGWEKERARGGQAPGRTHEGGRSVREYRGRALNREPGVR